MNTKLLKYKFGTGTDYW